MFYKKQAFTLVEIMIVCVCIGILVGPIFMLLRSGSESSLKGLARIDTTLEARKILHQVYADLKMACVPIKKGNTQVHFTDVLTKNNHAPNTEYEFLSFPAHEKYSDIFNEYTNSYNTEGIYRKVCKITYAVKGKSNSPFKTLERTTEFANNKSTKVLSNKISSFNIDKIYVKVDGKAENYFAIYLKLIDTIHGESKENMTIEEFKNKKQSEIIIVDFFDVVYPEYIHSYVDDTAINPNWHPTIKAPEN